LSSNTHKVIIIGGGPAGLMAADQLSRHDEIEVHVFDTKPSVGRKLLVTGVGGMNITFDEPLERFLDKYTDRRGVFSPLLSQFSPDHVRQWCHDLGIETFIGSSGKVFPEKMHSAPVLRAWLKQLKSRGVTFHTRHRCIDLTNESARFETRDGEVAVTFDVAVAATGGGSWKKLGSDGKWVTWSCFQENDIAPLKPANSGFNIAWSTHLKETFSGTPIKNVGLSLGEERVSVGEFIITDYGVEGSAIYRLSKTIRECLESKGDAQLILDLLPKQSTEDVIALLRKRKKKHSLSSFLKKQAKLSAGHLALLYEVTDKATLSDPVTLASAIKNLSISIEHIRPMDEAISTAGGVKFESLNEQLALIRAPKVYCVGEMLDWEAPTGGYLLTGCLATGFCAAQNILKLLGNR
jgi:hypothetical protein